MGMVTKYGYSFSYYSWYTYGYYIQHAIHGILFIVKYEKKYTWLYNIQRNI
jgi:hypothetical protein